LHLPGIWLLAGDRFCKLKILPRINCKWQVCYMDKLSHDELVHVFEFCNESDYLDFRLVCRRWNQAVESSLMVHVSPHVLVRERKYLSAIKLMNGPKVARKGIPLHPHFVLREACIIPHSGIIRYILGRFNQIHSGRVAGSIKQLTVGKVGPANIQAAIVFYLHGYKCDGFNLQHAIAHNSIELARILPSQKSISAKNIELLAYHGDIELARVIRSKISNVTDLTDAKFREIYCLNFDVAMLFVKFVSDDMKVILYDNILNEHAIAINYHEAIREIESNVTSYKQKIIQNNAAAEILVTVRRAILRGLSRLYPEINNLADDDRIRIDLSHYDIVKVKWDLPWSYKYEIEYDFIGGEKVISGFYVYSIYNVSRMEKEVRMNGGDCSLQ